MQQPWLQEGIYLDQSTFNARDQATCWEFPHLHGYTICWWVLHKDEDHIPAYGTGLCVIKYFLQAPTGNLFSCTKCYSISICKFAVGYATSIYFLEVEFFFFQFEFYIYTEMDFFFIFPTFPIIQYRYRYLSKPVFHSNFRLGCSPLYISFGSATKQTCSLSSRFWGILQ